MKSTCKICKIINKNPFRILTNYISFIKWAKDDLTKHLNGLGTSGLPNFFFTHKCEPLRENYKLKMFIHYK